MKQIKINFSGRWESDFKVSSRYEHGKLNIKLPNKEYRMLVSQDNKRLGRLLEAISHVVFLFCRCNSTMITGVLLVSSRYPTRTACLSVYLHQLEGGVGLVGWSTPPKSPERDLVRSCTWQHKCTLINDENWRNYKFGHVTGVYLTDQS